jgi:hypothetical protein
MNVNLAECTVGGKQSDEGGVCEYKMLKFIGK